MQQKTDYDVIVVGAGIVGLTFALAIAKNSFRILILDKQLPSTHVDTTQYDIRVSAITPASVKVFKALNVWQDIQKIRVSPYKEMRVWDAGGNGNIHFDCAEIASDNLGYIIENKVIQATLLNQLKEHDCVKFLPEVCIDEVNYFPQNANVKLSNGAQYSARLIVGADGANSAVRELAGIKNTEWDYEHSAIVATVRTSIPHQQTAWQRFLATGPLAFLPLKDSHTCSIVWSAVTTEAERLYQLNEEEFQQELAAAFENRLGEINLMSKRIIFPLRMRHAKHYVKSRVALMGDAAHTIHPLAGQGVNLGIMDAACLHETLIDMYNKNRDIGAHYNLRRYERRRKGDNMSMLAVVEFFKRFFSLSFLPARWLRNTGLELTNKMTPLKNAIMYHAMGLTGDQPLLVKNAENYQ